MSAVRLDAIKVGDRFRADLGDLDALAKSIAEVGLLHPPVVDKDNRLLAGYRRIEALRQLGWVETPVTVAESVTDEDLALQAEQEENTCRKDFTPGEAHALWTARKARIRVEAKERQHAGQVKGAHTPAGGVSITNDDQDSEPKKKRQYESRTGHLAAKGTGYSAASLERVQAVKNAINDPNRNVASRAAELSEQLDAGTITPNAAVAALNETLAGVTLDKITTNLPAAKRVEQITGRAQRGMNVSQIAADIGVNEAHVRKLANEHGIAIPATEATGKGSRRTIDPDRVVTELINTLEAAVTSVGLIDVAAVTINRTEAATSIDGALSALRKFSKQLKEEDQ